jgi:hypothetical protein
MMPDQDSLPTGTLEEVQQDGEEIYNHPPICVQVEGVVPVHTTGSKHGVSFNRKINTVDGAYSLLKANPRRRIVRLLCDQAFYVSNGQQGLVTGAAANWLANVVLEITHTDDVWVYLPIDGVMSVMGEDWAD